MSLSLPLPSAVVEAPSSAVDETLPTTSAMEEVLTARPMDEKIEFGVIYVPYQSSQKQRKLNVKLKQDRRIDELKQEVEKNVALSLFSTPGAHSVS